MGWDDEDREKGQRMVTGIDEDEFEFEDDEDPQLGRMCSAVGQLDDRIHHLIDRARYYGDSVKLEHLEEILVELRRIRRDYGG